MFIRMFSILKHILLTIIRLTCRILRCGRRKKVTIDESLPTDIVIGDAKQTFANYGNGSTLSNGYEISQPSFYDTAVAEHQKHPYQSHASPPTSGSYGMDIQEDDSMQMEAWEQWGYNDSTLQMINQGKSDVKDGQNQDDADENYMDYFSGMEPSVKVKKIYVKKKTQNIQKERKNLLAVNQDLDFATTGELDAWKEEEVDGGGWVNDDVELNEIDTAKVAREAQELRKQERLRRAGEQKRQKHTKKASHHEHKLATKVSYS